MVAAGEALLCVVHGGGIGWIEGDGVVTRFGCGVVEVESSHCSRWMEGNCRMGRWRKKGLSVEGYMAVNGGEDGEW